MANRYLKPAYFLIITTIILATGLNKVLAQNKPYRDASNPHYWKNRKPFEGYWQQDVAYRIKANIDDQTDIVDAEMELTYYNNSPDTLMFLYFHLYQNAFIKGGYLEQLNLANNFKQQFGPYEANGKGTEIESVEIIQAGGSMPRYTDEFGNMAVVDPIATRYKATPWIDYSIMRVDLQKPLLPQSSLVIKIKFKTYFDAGGNQRRRMKTFTDNWGNKQYDGVHWYPRICVYDRKFGWETDQHLGKEFYGEYGSYDVELTFPNHFVVDATGELQNRESVLPADLRAKLDIKNFKDKPWDEKPSVVITPDGSKKTWHFKSINTHDFAWVADPTFRIGEQTLTLANGETVSCIALAQEPHARGWQDAAAFTAKVIDVYSTDIGAYAYPKMIVADARDGMEYPMLTLDGGSSPSYYGLLAHEVGHNWFFGMVGTNETYRASLDEGFTQFLTNWSMTRIFGEVKPTAQNPNPMSRMDQTVYWGYLRDAIKNQDAFLNTHSDDFDGALNHGGGYGHVYYKTATMLYNLQYVLGDSLFLGAMQHYFNQWKMCHPYTEDFRNSITQYTKADLNWFFDQWLETTKRIDYGITEVELEKKIYKEGTKEETAREYEIEFMRYGEMQMPIDFTVVLKDSSIYKYTIPNTYFAKKEKDRTVLPVWRGWGKLNPEYEAVITLPAKSEIKNVIIDPTYRLADIDQRDNSSKAPVYFSFDDFKKDAPDRKHYTLTWRPDIWYNSIDGIKAGLNLSGNYLNTKDVFRATVWANTTLLNDYTGKASNPLNATFYYRDFVRKHTYLRYDLRYLDGLIYAVFGVDNERKIGANTNLLTEIYFKGLRRNGAANLDYLLYPTQWNANESNNTLNIDMTVSYSYSKGFGEYKQGLRASFLSDYAYSSIYLQWINQHQLSKFELRSRFFVQAITGDDIAPESQLFLAGANPEEMMENKFIRSRAFVPTSWLAYGNNTNHFHAGGGLNIRGYAGYLVPDNVLNTQVYLYAGNLGGSMNIELDFDKFINFKPKKLQKYFHIDSYLFADAGMIGNTFKQGEFGLTQKRDVNSNIMVSAGAGMVFTIKRWLNYDAFKPFALRFDVPLFLNNTPFVDGEYIRYRWILGINRSF
ncbi:MAG: M1 family metallopeptidase [Bacteroidia bacterium]|jgi:aminopeptidase N|nr:M1 family metallopeptidase [Bacteroidia bacterium]